MYVQGSSVQIQIPTHWHLIGRSVTASPPVLSPRSISPPLSANCASFPAI